MLNLTVAKMIAYYRVSTKRQGKSGLGLEAQQKTVQDFIAADRRRVLIADIKTLNLVKVIPDRNY